MPLAGAPASVGSPWYRIRGMRVFPDKDILIPGPRLAGTLELELAIADSAWLVPVASPNSGASEWVGEELDGWLQLGAKAVSVWPRDPALAAQISLVGVALRPSGIAASALRSAVARLADDLPPRFATTLPQAPPASE